MKIIVLENADKIGKGKKYHLEKNLNEFAGKKNFIFVNLDYYYFCLSRNIHFFNRKIN